MRKITLGFGLLVFSSFAFGKLPVYQTHRKPVPASGESVKLYSKKFISCKELAKPILRACPAYGVLGMKLCYVYSAKTGVYTVAPNEYVPHLGAYNGNDCMERARLTRFLCDHKIEASHYSSMNCVMQH